MFTDLPFSRLVSELHEGFERQVFFEGVFATRGALAETARCYSELDGELSPKDCANTFGDYRAGKHAPRHANKLWQFSAALRLATNQRWCAGPLLLFVLFKVTDFIAVVRVWRSLFGADASELLAALPTAARALPSDYNRELASLYEYSNEEIQEDRRLRAEIARYIKDGVFSDFGAARKSYLERSAARDVWTLSAEAERQFDYAWSQLAVARSGGTMVDGLPAPGTDEPGLAYAYAVAEAPWVHARRVLVIRALLDWCRTSTA
jgi:hypothetical protein